MPDDVAAEDSPGALPGRTDGALGAPPDGNVVLRCAIILLSVSLQTANNTMMKMTSEDFPIISVSVEVEFGQCRQDRASGKDCSRRKSGIITLLSSGLVYNKIQAEFCLWPESDIHTTIYLCYYIYTHIE